MKGNMIHMGGALGCAFLVAAIDQYVKRLVVGKMVPDEPLPLLDGIFSLTYRQNTGAAFSIFRDAPMAVLVGLSLIVLAVFGIIIYPHIRKRGGVFAAALVMGGALGNLIDRVRLHYVVDYLDFRVWPVFNLADMAIVIGAITLVLVMLFPERQQDDVPGGDRT